MIWALILTNTCLHLPTTSMHGKLSAGSALLFMVFPEEVTACEAVGDGLTAIDSIPSDPVGNIDTEGGPGSSLPFFSAPTRLSSLTKLTDLRAEVPTDIGCLSKSTICNIGRSIGFRLLATRRALHSRPSTFGRRAITEDQRSETFKGYIDCECECDHPPISS